MIAAEAFYLPAVFRFGKPVDSTVLGGNGIMF